MKNFDLLIQKQPPPVFYTKSFFTELLWVTAYLKLDTVPLIIYTYFVFHNFCQTHSTCVLDEDEVKAHKERHKLEEANMNKQLDPIYSLNMHEGKYI